MTIQMPRSVGLFVIALALVATSPAPAARTMRAAQTRTRAEVNVLQTAARKWKKWRKYGLFNPETHLLADNTQAICHGRGKPRAGTRYVRFVCVVRPQAHRGRQGLWLKYRALSKGRCRIRVLAYRRR
jgi:hypothetical protein